MAPNDLLACYEALAKLAADALASARSRDWETLARQQEEEAAVLAALKRHGTLPRYSPDVLSRQEALIHLILDSQRQTEALLRPWRDEIGAQLQSASSSRMLARTYGTHDGA